MSDSEKKVLEALVSLGQDASHYLAENKTIGNMGWYKLSIILKDLAYDAGKLNQAE